MRRSNRNLPGPSRSPWLQQKKSPLPGPSTVSPSTTTTLGARLASMEDNMLIRMAAFESRLQVIQTPTQTTPPPTDTDVQTLTTAFKEFKDNCLKELSTIRAVVDELQRKTVACEERVDDLEQYSRRNCLLIHGIPEKTRESTTDLSLDLFYNKLGIDIDYHDIDRTHRIGSQRRSGSKPRPIIVKFVSYQARDEVWFNKSKLKNTKITVTESLTKIRQQLFRAARMKVGMKNCWTHDGNIIIIDHSSGRKTSIRRMEDIPDEMSGTAEDLQNTQQPSDPTSNVHTATQNGN